MKRYKPKLPSRFAYWFSMLRSKLALWIDPHAANVNQRALWTEERLNVVQDSWKKDIKGKEKGIRRLQREKKRLELEVRALKNNFEPYVFSDEPEIVSNARGAASRMVSRAAGIHHYDEAQWPEMHEDTSVISEALDELERRIRADHITTNQEESHEE